MSNHVLKSKLELFLENSRDVRIFMQQYVIENAFYIPDITQYINEYSRQQADASLLPEMREYLRSLGWQSCYYIILHWRSHVDNINGNNVFKRVVYMKEKRNDQSFGVQNQNFPVLSQ